MKLKGHKAAFAWSSGLELQIAMSHCKLLPVSSNHSLFHKMTGIFLAGQNARRYHEMYVTCKTSHRLHEELSSAAMP